MTRIRIDDLPVLEELGQEELQGIYGEGLFPGERLRLLAAAATLGLSLASAPFATAGNQGRGQGGRSGHSQGPSRTSAPLQGQRTSGNSRGGIRVAQAPQHTPGHSQHQGGWHQGGWHPKGWHHDGGHGGPHYFENVGSYCHEHGVKFSHGFYYAGKVQPHFTEKWYDWRYETYLYFDPHAHCPYYWCEAHGVFYPIQYIETVPPGAKGPGPLVGGGPRGGGPGGGGPGAGGGQGGGAPGAVAPPDGAGQIPGGAAGGAGGAPGAGTQGGGQGGGVQQGGAQGGGAQGGGAPVGDGSAAGSEGGPAGDVGAGGAAPGANGGAGAAPAKPGAAPSGVSVAKRGTAKKQLQTAPPGTFDEAIPEDLN